jgi:CRISPR-associated protein Cas5t
VLLGAVPTNDLGQSTDNLTGRAFLLAERGRLTLPVWVDHVGSAGTRYATGNLVPDWPFDRIPGRSQMPRIEP